MSNPVYLIRPTDYYQAFEATNTITWENVQSTAQASLEALANIFIYLLRGGQFVVNFMAVRLPCMKNRLMKKVVSSIPAPVGGIPAQKVAVLGEPDEEGKATPPGSPIRKQRALVTPSAPQKAPSPRNSPSGSKESA